MTKSFMELNALKVEYRKRYADLMCKYYDLKIQCYDKELEILKKQYAKCSNELDDLERHCLFS